MKKLGRVLFILSLLALIVLSVFIVYQIFNTNFDSNGAFVFGVFRLLSFLLAVTHCRYFYLSEYKDYERAFEKKVSILKLEEELRELEN